MHACLHGLGSTPGFMSREIDRQTMPNAHIGTHAPNLPNQITRPSACMFVCMYVFVYLYVYVYVRMYARMFVRMCAYMLQQSSTHLLFSAVNIEDSLKRAAHVTI